MKLFLKCRRGEILLEPRCFQYKVGHLHYFHQTSRQQPDLMDHSVYAIRHRLNQDNRFPGRTRYRANQLCRHHSYRRRRANRRKKRHGPILLNWNILPRRRPGWSINRLGRHYRHYRDRRLLLFPLHWRAESTRR